MVRKRQCSVVNRLVPVGNRFANEFYAKNSSDGDLGSCFNIGCDATVLKELPCIYKAITDGNLDDLLKCGLGKPDVGLA